MEEMNPATLVILSSLLGGFLTSCVARAKGRNFKGWGIYGVLLPFLALPHIIIAKSQPTKSRLQTVGKFILSIPSRLRIVDKSILLIAQFILRWRYWLLSPLMCVYFYGLITVMDEVTDTEELFPNTDGMLIAAIFFIVMGWVIAAIAFNKGRNNIGVWFLYGALCPFPALPHVMIVGSRPEISEIRRSRKRV